MRETTNRPFVLLCRWSGRVALVIDADRARRLGLENISPDQSAALARWLSHTARALPAEADDYPVGHSMDVTFFAMDASGHVGVFFSGSAGPAPSGSLRDESLFSVLRQLRGEPEPKEEDDDPDWDAAEEEAADGGLYLYEYIEESNPLLLPYTLIWEPGEPLHADQLPPKLRQLFKRVRFDQIAFPDTERLQIVEHVKCFFYSDWDAAYLAGDDKTVRPIPGREKKYRQWCLDFRNQHPGRAKKLHFEGLEDEPAKPKPKPKPKRKPPRKRKGGRDE